MHGHAAHRHSSHNAILHQSRICRRGAGKPKEAKLNKHIVHAASKEFDRLEKERAEAGRRRRRKVREGRDAGKGGALARLLPFLEKHRQQRDDDGDSDSSYYSDSESDDEGGGDKVGDNDAEDVTKAGGTSSTYGTATGDTKTVKASKHLSKKEAAQLRLRLEAEKAAKKKARKDMVRQTLRMACTVI